MKFDSRTIRKSLNKSFLKEPIDRTQFNAFKYAFEQLLDHMDAATIRGEHEEHFKNFLKPFFQSNGFKDFYINTSARIDLAIHNGSRGKDSVGAIIEVKRSEEHTSELQSRGHLVCRLLLEKKNKQVISK